MQQNWGTLFSINCRRRKSPKFGLKEREREREMAKDEVGKEIFPMIEAKSCRPGRLGSIVTGPNVRPAARRIG
jgi:hypothetical protein